MFSLNLNEEAFFITRRTLKFILLFWMVLLICETESSWAENHEKSSQGALDKYSALIKKINSLVVQKISPIEKGLDGIEKFEIISRKYQGSNLKYKLKQNIVSENCILGISTEIKKSKSEKALESFSGPVDLSLKDLKISLVDYERHKNWGWEIVFSPQNISLIFETKTERKKYLTSIEKLQRPCQEKQVLLMELAKMNFSMEEKSSKGTNLCLESPKIPTSDKEILKNINLSEGQVEHLKVPDGFGFGVYPVHRLNDGKESEISLLSGEQSFVQRYLTALEAKKSIYVQALAFSGDDSGLALGDLLIKKKGDGLDVEIIQDALTNFIDIRDGLVRENTYRLYHNMMAAGIRVHGFSCGSLGKFLKKQVAKSIKLRRLDPALQRVHEKIWVTDRKKAIIGGINIRNDYFRVNPAGPDLWRDQDLLVEGKDIVEDVSNIFQANAISFRNNYRDPKDHTSCFNPHKVGSADYKAFLKRYSKRYRVPNARESVRSKKWFSRNVVEYLKEGEGAEKETSTPGQRNSRLQVIKEFKKRWAGMNPFKTQAHRVQEARVIQSRPKIGETNILRAYIDMIDQAKEEILIANSYFIPTLEVKEALVRAGKRGVKIKIITNSLKTNDVPLVSYVSRYYFKELLDVQYKNAPAMEIYEWIGQKEGNKKIDEGMIHAKFAVIDRKLSFVGSYNLDPASQYHNSEIGVAFKDPNLSQALATTFMEKDLQFCRKVDYGTALKYYRLRGSMKKLKDKMMLSISKKVENVL